MIAIIPFSLCFVHPKTLWEWHIKTSFGTQQVPKTPVGRNVYFLGLSYSKALGSAVDSIVGIAFAGC
jgi:hypothetical protein